MDRVNDALSDPYRLERFVAAQDQGGTYERAVAELRAGAKVSHWMWFVFPQVAGLGRSAMAREFAISSVAEARAYLAHPVLGPRLRECARIVAEHRGPVRGADLRPGGRHEAPLVDDALRGRRHPGRRHPGRRYPRRQHRRGPRRRGAGRRGRRERLPLGAREALRRRTGRGNPGVVVTYREAAAGRYIPPLIYFPRVSKLDVRVQLELNPGDHRSGIAGPNRRNAPPLTRDHVRCSIPGSVSCPLSGNVDPIPRRRRRPPAFDPQSYGCDLRC